MRKGEQMQVATQFSVFLINKPGVMATVTGALADADINMVALALMDSGEHGALRIVCDDADKARAILTREHDRWTETDVLTLELDNGPGTFARASKRLAEEQINITYAYCTACGRGGKAMAVFKVADCHKAAKILQAK